MEPSHPVSTLRSQDASHAGALVEPTLEETVSALLAIDIEADLLSLRTAFVDELLIHLGWERGFLLVGPAPSAGSSAERAALECVSARIRDEVSGGLKHTNQADAELFVLEPLIRRAVQSDEPILERHCLVELPPPGAEVYRSILCAPIELTKTETGVVYLDNDVLDEKLVQECLDRFRKFLRLGSPILKSAYLEREIRELKRQIEERPNFAGVANVDQSEGPEDGNERPWDIDDNDVPVFHGIVGRSERLQKIFEVVERIKDTDFNVCLFGESGTGKELLAAAIHRAGKRRDAEFISENCGAISETLLESELFGHVKGSFTGADENHKGLFELASGGTLFLDEIGDMSEGMQRKLLRVLQEGVIRPIGSKDVIRIDTRVICASNRDLKLLMERGSFRADLYYRLNVISIEIPPLRERIEDTPYLVKWFLKDLQKKGPRRRLSQSAMNTLMSYSWPGNIRELMNVLQRLTIAGTRRIITRKEILPLLSGGPARSYVSEGLDEREDDNQIVLRIPQRGTFNEIIAECEKAVLLNALKENRWNKSRVTKVLQIPRQSLYNKIAKFNLQKKWGQKPS